MKSSLVNKMMIHCHEATYFMAKKEEGKLSLVDKLKLSVHTSLCAACKKFEKQTTQIKEESRTIMASDSLPTPTRERLKRTLEDIPPAN
ncbi:MAG: hypothetical protein B7Z54_01420 [Sphingobacteriales bacterium 12-47-4]|nr:MAG: hypothetical protein B7Z54_01420 [Sphingobacteriales bacterium 12-47-4]